MRYLTVDGMFSGTGVRDTYEGNYLELDTLGLSGELVQRITTWVSRYREAHFNGFEDSDEVRTLDSQGIELCKALALAVPGSKVEYYSNAKTRRIFY